MVYDGNWLPQSAAWGHNTMNDVIGEHPDAPSTNDQFYDDGEIMRALFSWQGYHSDASFDNIGGPNAPGEGHLGAAQFVGVVTLHADTSPADDTDNINQPSTTWFITSDDPTTSGNDQYNEVKSTNELTTAVISFATSKFQTDIKAIANGTATAETINSYKTDILNYIATSESVTASLLAPSITAIDDNVSTDEDTQVTIDVLANDSYLSSAPITVTAANPSNGAIVNNANVITYTPSADFNGADSFSYTITQGDKTASAVVSITVNAINDAPSIDIASTLQAAENQTAVATISVSDPDADDTLTLSMSGTDADSFDLSSSNVLTFKTPPDAETKNSYSITFSLTDGTLTVTKDVQVQVVDIDEEMNTSNPCSEFIQYARANEFRSVSYTHLTLPTIYSV